MNISGSNGYAARKIINHKEEDYLELIAFDNKMKQYLKFIVGLNNR